MKNPNGNEIVNFAQLLKRAYSHLWSYAYVCFLFALLQVQLLMLGPAKMVGNK